jgi:hypothetical protein
VRIPPKIYVLPPLPKTHPSHGKAQCDGKVYSAYEEEE